MQSDYDYDNEVSEYKLEFKPPEPDPTGMVRLSNDIVEKLKSGDLKIVSTDIDKYTIFDSSGNTLLTFAKIPSNIKEINYELESIYKKTDEQTFSLTYEITNSYSVGKSGGVLSHDKYNQPIAHSHKKKIIENPNAIPTPPKDTENIDLAISNYTNLKNLYYTTKQNFERLVSELQSEMITNSFDGRSTTLSRLNASILEEQNKLKEIERSLLRFKEFFK